MKWLKDLIGDDFYNQLFPQEKADLLKKITDKIGTKKVLIEEKDGDYIPKSRFDEVNTKKTALETELQTTKDSLTKVTTDFEAIKKEKDGGKKTLEEQITALTSKIATLENGMSEKDKQLLLSDKRAIVERTLRGLKANEKYLPMLMREFEAKHPLDKLDVVDGKIKDAETILKPFQESNKDLFGEVKRQGYNPKGEEENGAGEFYTPEQLNFLSKDDVKANYDKVQKSLEFINNQGN